MTPFHLHLCLEYFAAQPKAERTTARLNLIVAHVGQTYCLSAETQQEVYAEALATAQRRGLIQA